MFLLTNDNLILQSLIKNLKFCIVLYIFKPIFSQYPEFTQRAKQEIHEKLLNVEEISFDDLNLLTFTNCFIKECFRHYGVVAFNGRKSVKECNFGKYTFPKGTYFGIPQFYLNSNGNYYEDFNPERYKDKGMKFCKKYLIL